MGLLQVPILAGWGFFAYFLPIWAISLHAYGIHMLAPIGVRLNWCIVVVFIIAILYCYFVHLRGLGGGWGVSRIYSAHLVYLVGRIC